MTSKPPSSSAKTASIRPRRVSGPERRLERHLDLDRLPVGPLAGEERLLQLGQRAVGGGELVAGAGQLVEVDQPRRAEPLLQPGVEGGAAAGLRRGCRGHRAAQPAGELGRVAAQGDQRRHRQVRGQRDVDRRAGVPGALAQQQVGVAHPLRRPAGRRRRARARRRAGAARPRSTSSAAAVSARRRRTESGSAGHDADRPLLERRVGRVVVGRLGAQCTTVAGAVLARLPRGVQQRRRPARLDAVAPPAAGAEQQVLGPGDRDVAEADLLAGAEVLPRPARSPPSACSTDGLVARAGHRQPQPRAARRGR